MSATIALGMRSMREAIRQLEAEGLVTFERNVGARVSMVDDSQYRSSMQSLSILEGAATALAARRLTADDVRAACDEAALALVPLPCAGLPRLRAAPVLLVRPPRAALPGALLPQRSLTAAKVHESRAQHPTLGPVLDRFGAFDVFAAPWFAAIYLLLFVSLVGCLVPRSFDYARSARARPVATPKNLARLPHHTSATVTLAPRQVRNKSKKDAQEKEKEVLRGIRAGVTEERGENPPYPIEIHAVHAPPNQALIEASKRTDLLVVGHRGRGGLRDLVLGSVAEVCVRQARCPVLIARPSQPAETRPETAAAGQPPAEEPDLAGQV